MSNDPVIAALQDALSKAPDPALRVALGDRYLSLDQPDLALDAFSRVLSEDPANVDVLRKAAAAADAAGMAGRASGYRHLVSALGGSGEAPAQPPKLAVVEDGDEAAPPSGDEDATVLRLVPEPDDAERITFDDVGGLDHVKKRIEISFLAPLRNPELFRAYGKSIKGGLLLYGPPGCGKTHIARATAGEVGARFTSIGLVDVLDMWVGESEKRLHELFEQARREAPVVVFLDELDAIGQKRSQMRNSTVRHVVNQLLVELDGLQSSDGVYVLAATNHPWDVDPALKRPGRFDRTVLVTPPDAAARRTILERHLRGRPMGKLDLDLLAQKTRDFSGADLVHLADSAVEAALDEALRTGDMRPIGMGDFGTALSEVRSSIGPWVEMARNYALYANEGGSYDDLAAWLKGRR